MQANATDKLHMYKSTASDSCLATQAATISQAMSWSTSNPVLSLIVIMVEDAIVTPTVAYQMQLNVISSAIQIAELHSMHASISMQQRIEAQSLKLLHFLLMMNRSQKIAIDDET